MLKWLDRTGAAAALEVLADPGGQEAGTLRIKYYPNHVVDSVEIFAPAWYFPQSFRLPPVTELEAAGLISVLIRSTAVAFFENRGEDPFDKHIRLNQYSDQGSAAIESFLTWANRSCDSLLSLDCNAISRLQTFLWLRDSETARLWERDNFNSIEVIYGVRGGHYVYNPDMHYGFELKDKESLYDTFFYIDGSKKSASHITANSKEILDHLEKRLQRTRLYSASRELDSQFPGYSTLLDFEAAHVKVFSLFEEHRENGINPISDDEEAKLKSALPDALRKTLIAGREFASLDTASPLLRIKAVNRTSNLISRYSYEFRNSDEAFEALILDAFELLNANADLALEVTKRMPLYSTFFVSNLVLHSAMIGDLDAKTYARLGRLSKTMLEHATSAASPNAIHAALTAVAANNAMRAAKVGRLDLLCDAVNHWYEAARLPRAGLRYNRQIRDLFDRGLGRSLDVFGKERFESCFVGFDVDFDRIYADIEAIESER